MTGQEEILVRGKKVTGRDRKVVLAYYKPKGVVCTERDAHAQRILMKEINYPKRVTYAGRLDKDSEGLILLTNDGGLIDAMMRGKNAHEKEYIVKADRAWDDAAIANMRAGVYLEELGQTTRPCQIEKIGDKTHTRDPKVWKGKNGWYMVLGSQNEEGRGKLLFLPKQGS